MDYSKVVKRAAFQSLYGIAQAVETEMFSGPFVGRATESLILEGTAQQHVDVLLEMLASNKWRVLVDVVYRKYNPETHGWLVRQVNTQLEAARADAARFI